MTPLDPILALISARGGSISRQQIGIAVEELRTSDETPDTYEVTNAIKALLLLGHLDEVEKGKLVLAPSIWARLPPRNGAKAVLCGYHSSCAEDVLPAKLKAEPYSFKICNSSFTISAVTLEAALASELDSAAHITGIPITGAPSAWELVVAGEDIKNLHTALQPKWSSGRPSAAAQYFDSQSLRFILDDGDVSDAFRLWRWMGDKFQWQFAVSSKTQFAYLPPSSVLLAKHAVVSAQSRSWLRYSASTQIFACPIQALPPAYLARGLTLCNGMLRHTVVSANMHWILWKNVPPAIARQVSEKLGQGLCPLGDINRK